MSNKKSEIFVCYKTFPDECKSCGYYRDSLEKSVRTAPTLIRLGLLEVYKILKIEECQKFGKKSITVS